MMLRIGNRAFTFVEIMVAVAILGLAATLVYESFFTSLDLFNYYSDYLFSSLRMNELLWLAQDSLTRLGPAAQLDREGEFANAGKRFSWNLSYGPVGSVEGLYKIDLVTLLKTGHRTRRLTRSGYAKYEAK